MFNSDISTWDVSNVIDMSYMFHASTYDWGLGFMKFNIDISQWDVSNVTNMSGMFLGASAFEQDISLWDVAKVTDMSDMFEDTALSTLNYDALLIGWSVQELTSNVSFSAGDSKYSERSEAARLHLIEHFGWVVTDAGKLE